MKALVYIQLEQPTRYPHEVDAPITIMVAQATGTRFYQQDEDGDTVYTLSLTHISEPTTP